MLCNTSMQIVLIVIDDKYVTLLLLLKNKIAEQYFKKDHIIVPVLLGSTLNRWSRCKPGFNPFTCTWDFFGIMYTGDHVIVKYQHET